MSTTGKLKGQVVLVTGAVGGIGRSVSQALANAEMSIVAIDKDSEGLASLAKDLGVPANQLVTFTCDITDQPMVDAVVEAAVEKLGRIDALVHCAGLDAPAGFAWNEPANHWLKILDVNLNGAWWLTRAVLPKMIARGGGRIILVSSVAARSPTGRASVAYNAAKAGINGLTIGLSAQVEQYGILVNAIAPGPTGTGTAMTASELETYLSAYPLGEGGPAPVANACLYLLGDGGDWISGAILNVSGGRYRG
ncbi:SDR family oxidoreductase [Mesorhizobium sp. M7D.F.Ca.US.004.01.2.1]|uniref:SDR family NAD(P)-dependent oxidoreductase n=2 Tax=unclassified Mesorhizobium TaxID=325217 RepID=UPI0013DFEB03|nr:SDR family oxidoreductase [Mesorhizobium sp. M7D.F.Ca.US.004.01.2.1]